MTDKIQQKKEQAKAKLDQLIAERALVFAEVTDIGDKANSLNDGNVASHQCLLDKLDRCERQFSDAQKGILQYNVPFPVSERVDTLNPQKSFNDLSYAIRVIFAKLTAKAADMRAPQPQANPSMVSSPVFAPSNLPKLSLPKFGGDLNQWADFIGLYDSIVHNASNVAVLCKFHYLKSCLIGEAASVIAGFAISEANYALAYDALKKRYQSHRRLASHYIQSVLDFKPLANASLEGFKSFLQVHQNSLKAFEALQIANPLQFIMFSLAVRNLDSATRCEFESRRTGDVVPSYDELINFITQQTSSLELAQSETAKAYNKPAKSMPKMLLASTSKVSSTDPEPPKPSGVAPNPPLSLNRSSSFTTAPSGVSKRPYACPVCKNAHSIAWCPSFNKMPHQEKIRIVQQHKRCFNCLGAHLREHCNSTRSCKECGSSKHHSLLHTTTSDNSKLSSVSTENGSPTKAPAPAIAEPSDTMQAMSCVRPSSSDESVVLLGTVQALILDAFGDFRPIRAVLDLGSQVSAISGSFVKNLGFQCTGSPVSISGIGQAGSKTHGIVSCTLKSRYNQIPLHATLHVLPSIAQPLPSIHLPDEVMQRFRHLDLADNYFHAPGKVDMLIGADLLPELVLEGSPMVKGKPSVLPTVFGCVIVGPVAGEMSNSSHVSLLCQADPLASMLSCFWELEKVPAVECPSPDDALCEDNFKKTLTRDTHGRYIVSLPFKLTSVSPQPNSRAAFRAFLNLETRLLRKPAQYEAYIKFMSEYLSLGHMSKANHPSGYVMPHHCVTKSNELGTKIRVVFNGSYGSPNGKSINEQLVSGPKLQSDISHILIRFRFQNIALCTDIRMMYRQILVRPEDRQFQHIFWRSSAQFPVEEYELNTVTYGMTPSAFLAQRCLQQLVSDEGTPYPLASKAVLQSTYVDDIITGSHDITSALDLRNQLQSLLQLGGFELRKWSSNRPEVLEGLPQDHLEAPILFSDSEKTVKILGLCWDSRSDVFSFQVKAFSGPSTKRNMLSYIFQIFDPLGFLAPIVFALKLIFQELWAAGLDWDEEVGLELSRKWALLISDLPNASSIRVPRCISISIAAAAHIVGFCDASQKGYAAVIYVISSRNNVLSSNLLVAKSRLAPLKTLSIPRLELCGALLLTSLLDSLKGVFSKDLIAGARLYTDAQLVLTWLSISPHKLNTFVANRVVCLLEKTAIEQWHHVRTQLNPADLACRGASASDLKGNDLWWHGPSFLAKPFEYWPTGDSASSKCSEGIPELKQPSALLAQVHEAHPLLGALDRISSFQKLRRTFAWILRFTQNSRMEAPFRAQGPLSTDELLKSESMLVRVTQASFFAKEIVAIRKGTKLSRSLSKLSPYIDEEGLIRVGGRLANASLPPSTKNPLLLPKNGHLSALICSHFHISSLHSGPQTVQALISVKYWIISVRCLVRKRINQCLTCHRFRAKTFEPPMGNLPSCRVASQRAFSVAGVDYAGPFTVKINTLRTSRTTKGYLCLFVCTSTKAVHLEFASSLSTDAFFACFERFVARRGLPFEMLSDCGRNFVGAARMLDELYQFLRREHSRFSDHLTLKGIRWRFNPPYAPHFGGLWEAAVKSAKKLLHRQIGASSLTFEEYTTLFAKIEAVLNSRPLCALSDDPDESPSYLSPGHFLTGAPLISSPTSMAPSEMHPRSRWRLLCNQLRSFWQRWSSEYLVTLNSRQRWVGPNSGPSVGDVVLLREPNTIPSTWLIGRILHTMPGPDGVVRVASVRTSDGTVTRAVRRLVPLPFS